MMFSSWIRLNYLYLILVGLLGLLMRLVFVGVGSLPYNNLLHSHSHTAFLGWIYPTLFIVLINTFLEKEHVEKFKIQLILTHILIPVMLFAFLAQSYGFYSILFSSLFQLLNYWFVFSFLSALKKVPASFAQKFLKIALWSLFASTFGPWALAIIKVAGLHTSNWYKMAIYFYLHFQYNGWILFAIFALFFKQMEKVVNKEILRFLTYMAWSLIPAYCLSLLDIFSTPWNFSLAAVSAILQMQALFFLLRFLWSVKNTVWDKGSGGWVQKVLASVALFSFCVKIVLQLLSIIPELTVLAFNNHDIIISFIHLIMLGLITCYLLVILAQNKILSLKSLVTQAGIIFFLTGFILMELFLAFRFSGIFLFSNPYFMASFSLMILSGLLFIYTGFFTKGTK